VPSSVETRNPEDLHNSLHRYLFRCAMVLAAMLVVCLAEYWIPAVLKIYIGRATAAGFTTLFGLGLVAYLCCSHMGHRYFSLSWQWSWVTLIPLLAGVGNTLTLVRHGLELVPPSTRITLTALGLAHAAIEEFSFRGVAFIGWEMESPRIVVLISSLGFALSHFAGLTIGHPMRTILPVVIMALPFGLIFGVIRQGTGSLLLPLIVHGVIDVSGYLAVASMYGHVSSGPTISPLISIASISVFCFHPAMRPNQNSNTAVDSV
jgi:membrane protease YdiL (CAAX protease family)